jgi:4-hydroxy-tetrahydrodipicolinate synthase
VSTFPSGVWPVMLTAFTPSLKIDWRGVDALTDWYLAAGVSGLFAVCLSSEMYALTGDERLALARHIVERAAGRVPVVASGTFGGPIESQAGFVRRMRETGVDAVVVIANQPAEEVAGEEYWQCQVERLLELTPEVPLGIYECPTPYHRLLSPALLGWTARTGRFHFHKDTSCRFGPIREKIAATRGTPFRFYNANTPTLLGSLEAGGDGYSGTAANWFPELIVWLCRHYAEEPERAARLQHLLTVCDRMVHHRYPATAKQYLANLGLPIEPHCRIPQVALEEPDMTMLEHLREVVREQLADLGLSEAAGAL